MPVVRAAAAAVGFLTVVPVARRMPLAADDVVRGAALFPVIGAGVGAAVGAVAAGLAGLIPPLAAAAVALAVGAVLTGALHLDALADAADALGARSRAQALEIMRDPGIGPFGTLALVLDLLVKAAALAALAVEGGAVLAALAAGRADGSGAILATRARPVTAAAAAMLAALIAVAAAGWAGVVIVAAAAAVAAVVALAAWRRFGGVTGDVLGCAIELAEAAALLVAAALAS